MAFTRAAFDHHSLALGYHRRLPSRIRTYLMETRGLSEEVICRYLLGWNGMRITIPIRDRDGKIIFFRLARDPEDRVSPKMISTPGSRVGTEREEVFPVVATDFATAKDLATTYALRVLKLREFALRMVGA